VAVRIAALTRGARAVLGPAYRDGLAHIVDLYGMARPADDDDSPPRAHDAQHVPSRRSRRRRAGVRAVLHAPDAGFPELLVGASIYPALQNFLLAAAGARPRHRASRAGTRTRERELRDRIGMPDDWTMAALVARSATRGRPRPRAPVAP